MFLLLLLVLQMLFVWSSLFWILLTFLSSKPRWMCINLWLSKWGKINFLLSRVISLVTSLSLSLKNKCPSPRLVTQKKLPLSLSQRKEDVFPASFSNLIISRKWCVTCKRAVTEKVSEEKRERGRIRKKGAEGEKHIFKTCLACPGLRTFLPSLSSLV